jgi:hypothetical protein
VPGATGASGGRILGKVQRATPDAR